MSNNIQLIHDFIQRYWVSANVQEPLQYWSAEFKFNYRKVWVRGNLKIVLTRLIRADLVEVFDNERLVLSYVDQSHQYPGFLGFNDVWESTDCNLEIIKNYLT